MELSKLWSLCLLCCVSQINAATSGDFKKFLDEEPFKSYNSKIFPRHIQTETIIVDIEYSIVAINNFDEQGGQIDLVGFITAKWENELLKWDLTTQHGIEYMYLPQDSFWRPSLIMSNSVSSLKELGDTRYRLRIDYQGKHEWRIGAISQTGCTVMVTYYPFDKQSCSIMLTPWGYTDDQVPFSLTASFVFDPILVSLIFILRGSNTNPYTLSLYDIRYSKNPHYTSIYIMLLNLNEK